MIWIVSAEMILGGIALIIWRRVFTTSLNRRRTLLGRDGYSPAFALGTGACAVFIGGCLIYAALVNGLRF